MTDEAKTLRRWPIDDATGKPATLARMLELQAVADGKELRFWVDFRSTEDAELDAELILVEDTQHTLDEIRNYCRTYRVAAQIADDQGTVLGSVLGDGEITDEPLAPDPPGFPRIR
jgi:hypothetical protein